MDDTTLQHYGVLGMKWGTRRYQNKDGTLTPKGTARYERDKRENASKKKDNRIDVSSPDPKRWAKEDMERSKKVIDTSSDLVKLAKNVEQETRTTVKKKRLDLSSMTDKEMREQINRELLEQQYDKLFNKESPETISRGRRALADTLEIAGDVLAVGSSSLAIALAIKELKGK